MTQSIRSNRGASMIFVLSALLITAFLSTALIQMNRGDRLSAVNFISSASARSAAKSGLIAAKAYLENPANTSFVENLANDWRTAVDASTDIQDIHINLPVAASPDGNGFYPMDPSNSNDNMRYKVTVLAFDPIRHNISLRSVGKGTGRSRATVTATYHLKGLGTGQKTIPTNALHMGGGGNEFNRAMDIYGDTYIKGGGQFYDNQNQVSNFRGRMFVDYVADSVVLFKGITIHDTAYLEGNVHITQFTGTGTGWDIFYGPLTTFKKASGFQRGLTLDPAHTPGQHTCANATEQAAIPFASALTIEDDGFYSNASIFITGAPINLTDNSVEAICKKGNQNNDATIYVDNNKTTITKNSSMVLKRKNFDAGVKNLFTNSTTIDSSTSDTVIVKSRLKAVNPINIGWDVSNLPAFRKVSDLLGPDWSPLSGATMNSLWSTHKNHTDENGREWLLLEYDTDFIGRPFDTTGDASAGFNHHVIWYINKTVEANSQFYEHTGNGLSILYIGPNGKLNGIGGCSNFRGLIYSVTPAENNYKALSGTSFHGAIYQKDGSGPLRIEGHPSETAPLGRFEVHYDPDVMREVSGLNILYNEDDPDASKIIIVKAGETVETELLSQSM